MKAADKTSIIKLKKICYGSILLSSIFVSVMFINHLMNNDSSKQSLVTYLLCYGLLIIAFMQVKQMGKEEDT